MPGLWVYIPNEIYKRLVYMSAENGKSESKNISLIVESYFRLHERKEVSNGEKKIQDSR